MQAIILAAGSGKRLSDITKGLPKCYLPLDGERMLERHIRLFHSRNIRDIIVVTGYQKSRLETDFKMDGVNFVFNPFFETTNVLASFWFGAKLLQGEFIYLHADTVFDERILDDLLATQGDAALSVAFHPCGAEEMKVRLKDGKIAEISKAILPESAEGEFIGLGKFSGHALGLLQREAEQCMVEKHFDRFFEFALERLIQQGLLRVRTSSTKDYPWCEIDFPEDYKHARLLFRTGNGPQ